MKRHSAFLTLALLTVLPACGPSEKASPASGSRGGEGWLQPEAGADRSAPISSGKRLALVFGNRIYDPAKEPGIKPNLRTPEADADAIAQTLRDHLGFEVFLKKNATLTDMVEAVEELKQKSRDAEAVIIFFAGHGVQSQTLGDNFLLPVQVKLAKEVHLKSEAYALKTLTDELKGIPALMKLVILDCCRDNPLEGRQWYTAARSAGATGLAEINGKTLDETTMIVFSTDPGKVAKDSIYEGDTHSPFAQALLDHWQADAAAGKSCADIMGKVETAVWKKTSEALGLDFAQRPKVFINGNISPFTTFVFRPGTGSGGNPQADAALLAKIAEMEAQLAKLDKGVPAVPVPAPGKSGGFTNTLGMKFVPVEGTQVHFCIHEVRVQDFRAFAEGPGRDKSFDYSKGSVPYTWTGTEFKQVAGKGWDDPGFKQDETHPVTCVSWEDAVAFCEWLNKQEAGRGVTYRLATDHEWSCAVGIGERENATDSPNDKDMKIKEVWPWGKTFPPADNMGNYADSAARKEIGSNFTVIDGYDDGYAFTAPVMSYAKAATKEGVYDLGGNVWEWVASDYEGKDLLGKDKSLTNTRALRGGSWVSYDSGYLLSADRINDLPTSRNFNLGFRVVCVVGGGG